MGFNLGFSSQAVQPAQAPLANQTPGGGGNQFLNRTNDFAFAPQSPAGAAGGNFQQQQFNSSIPGVQGGFGQQGPAGKQASQNPLFSQPKATSLQPNQQARLARKSKPTQPQAPLPDVGSSGEQIRNLLKDQLGLIL